MCLNILAIEKILCAQAISEPWRIVIHYIYICVPCIVDVADGRHIINSNNIIYI